MDNIETKTIRNADDMNAAIKAFDAATPVRLATDSGNFIMTTEKAVNGEIKKIGDQLAGFGRAHGIGISFDDIAKAHGK
ncbi:hypothetical protein F3J37_01215 [Pantoea sp. Al-1710]|uniref:Phage protein n=1 Tax=Candidatus Pantoea communis TaxID=2608354 RepID=A0ABX0RI67_9GAMM|nr:MULTISPECIES: hypothetical protein [Pantoea]NIG13003.1 hypothetical protein [Pantoea sp. Cy-640]NIG17296.1 hypothetical protein [Pantoea communis]